MNYILKKQHLFIFSLLLVLITGFSACTMKDELTVVPLKSLEQYKSEMNSYLAGQKLALDTTRVGNNKNNYKSALDSTTVKPSYLAAVDSLKRLLNKPDVTIAQITAGDKYLATPGKAFWAAIWICDRRALSDSILIATNLNTATVQGTLGGQVLPDVKAAFTAAISKATAVKTATTTVDLGVKMATDSLSKAKKIFIAAIIPTDLNAYIANSSTYINAQKSKVEASVVGYNMGEYPTTTRTNYLNAVIAAYDVVNKAGVTYAELSAALTSMIPPKAVFLPFLTDHRPLNDTIVMAETLSPTLVIGTAKGQVITAQKTALTTAITTAKTARENVALTDGATKAARFAIGQAYFKVLASITLGDLIIDAQTLLSATPIGTASGQVTTSVNFAFNTAITNAKKVRDAGTSTNSQMQTSIRTLTDAQKVFTDAIHH